MIDLGTRWDAARELWVCDRTERTHLKPRGSMIISHGAAAGWIAQKHWHPIIVRDENHPVTAVHLAGMFYHEVA